MGFFLERDKHYLRIIWKNSHLRIVKEKKSQEKEEWEDGNACLALLKLTTKPL